jgi:hypothetical protein
MTPCLEMSILGALSWTIYSLTLCSIATKFKKQRNHKVYTWLLLYSWLIGKLGYSLYSCLLLICWFKRQIISWNLGSCFREQLRALKKIVKSIGSIALFDRGMPMFSTRTHSFNQSNLVGSVVNDFNSFEKNGFLETKQHVSSYPNGWVHLR